MISDELKEILLSEEILEAWMPFSCKERVELIDKMWDVKLTGKTLSRFYTENNVHYKTTKQVYRKAIENRSSLEKERKDFAVVLGNVLAQDKEIIYIDESSF